MALTKAEEEELNPQQSFKGLQREVAELREMLEEWKDLVPGSKATRVISRRS